MDVTALASVATSLAHARTVVTVSTAVLRKALDLQAAGAAQLLQAATQSLQANNPPHFWAIGSIPSPEAKYLPDNGKATAS